MLSVVFTFHEMEVLLNLGSAGPSSPPPPPLPPVMITNVIVNVNEFGDVEVCFDVSRENAACICGLDNRNPVPCKSGING